MCATSSLSDFHSERICVQKVQSARDFSLDENVALANPQAKRRKLSFRLRLCSNRMKWRRIPVAYLSASVARLLMSERASLRTILNVNVRLCNTTCCASCAKCRRNSLLADAAKLHREREDVKLPDDQHLQVVFAFSRQPLWLQLCNKLQCTFRKIEWVSAFSLDRSVGAAIVAAPKQLSQIYPQNMA